jgi:hypothetical protein
LHIKEGGLGVSLWDAKKLTINSTVSGDVMVHSFFLWGFIVNGKLVNFDNNIKSTSIFVSKEKEIITY